MCVHIGADVVLANLLSGENKKQGVSFEEINSYCQKIKQQFIVQNNMDFIYFAIDQREVQDTIWRYPQYFNVFKDRFFCSDTLNVKSFNNRYSINIQEILQQAV